MATKRIFVPFGELKPDGKQFNNDGLLRATNVAPISGNYVAAQRWVNTTAALPAAPLGLHAHPTNGTWKLYYGNTTKLYEVAPTGFPWASTDKSRAAGGAYAALSAGAENGWQGASFGDAVVMTDYVDDPQLLTSPAASNFVKMAQSGGGNPGMDPKAKFAFPVRGNLFLANLNLSSGFDGLSAGPNPTVVAWSQTENIRQYGSYNVTPQLTGCGYQPLSYDFGGITGGVGGEYALIAMQSGWIRCDGPPYTFRPIVCGIGCRYPNSIVRYDRDVYFWGPSGPSVLIGGEGPIQVLGDGKVMRTLIDNTTGFSPIFSLGSSVDIKHVAASVDTVNGLVMFSFTSASASTSGGYSQAGDLTIVYNVSDGRFSFVENRITDNPPLAPPFSSSDSGVPYQRCGPDLGISWAPGRDLVGVIRYNVSGTIAHAIGIPQYAGGGSAQPYLERAFSQLDPNATTRILRVRPVFSQNAQVSTTVTVNIASKNRPYDVVTSTSFIGMADTHGWIVTPFTVFADFHLVGVGIATSDIPSIVEMEGYELEFVTGGVYAA